MKRALLFASLVLLLFPPVMRAQVRPTTPLLDATTEKQQGEYLAIQISSTDYFWIDWGSGVPKRYTKGSYGEENPIYDKVSGSNIKIYGESISHILAPSGGWTKATVGLSLKLLNIDLSNSSLAQIDLSEAALLNSLNVSSCKLKELTLGKKSKLTYLWAQGNQLSTIDLSGCSSLQNIDISQNQLSGTISLGAAITSADLSDNNLTEVQLAPESQMTDLSIRNNRLSSFSISGVPHLRMLDLFKNKLTSVSLQGKLQELVSLNLGKNQITHIDLTQCTELRGLTLSYNPIKKIDLSPCKELTSLSIHHTSLKELDLSHTVKLKNIEAMNGKLTAIDLSPCLELIEVWLTQNALSEVKLAPNNERLLCLQLAGNKLTPESIESIIKTLPNISGVTVPSYQADYLKHLSIRYNPSTDKVNLKPAQDKGWVLDVQPNESYPYLSFTTQQSKDADIEISVTAPTGSDIQFWGNEQKTVKAESATTTLKEVTVQDQQSYCLESKATKLDFSKANLSEIELYHCSDLSSLQVQGGSLTALDLSQAPQLKELYCLQNSISALSMTKLIESLPDRSASNDGLLYAMHLDQTLEKNICTKEHVDKAKLKGWSVKAWDPTKAQYVDYVPAAVPVSNFLTFTTEKAIGETVKIAVMANGEVTATGLKEAIKADGSFNTYTITDPSITLNGDIVLLYCNQNKLTALDISHCPNLKMLECFNNKLTELDLSKSGQLQLLRAWLNQFTNLDLSNCTELQKLYCQQNKLTSLDVTKNTKLTYLWCQVNQISSLDVTHCPLLLGLQCGGNKLSSLDVSKCPNLWNLYCEENQLAGLDVTKNKALKHLWCSDNPISSLDISACKKMEQLYCYNNQLTALDVTQCPNLKRLECSNNEISALDISNCPKLLSLSCEDNRMGCSAMEAIAIQLPMRTIDDDAALFAVTEEEMNAAPGNGNVMTKHAVEIAKAKNWISYYIETETEDEIEYAGLDGFCTDNAISFAVTVSKDVNGLVTVKGANDLNAVPYGTELTVEVAPEAGYELDKLMANEEDITATKRFIVKSNVKVTATFKVGTEAVAREGIALYPNPASSEANLFGVAPQGEVNVYGTDGARLLTITADQSGHAVLLVEGLPEGNYLVTFRDAMGVLTTRQLTIKR
ncbi:leucine-rich repeat domain-containing protein [Porphyromonas miyakawae]